MNIYEVNCLNTTYRIKAQTWSVGDEGLMFYDKELSQTAWFKTWDYWIFIGEEDETESS